MWQPQCQTLGIRQRMQWKMSLPSGSLELSGNGEKGPVRQIKMILSDTEKNILKKPEKGRHGRR